MSAWSISRRSFVTTLLGATAVSAIDRAVGRTAEGIPTADVFVSPAGRDSNAGTFVSPVATLGQAQTLIRARIAKKPNANYIVMVRGGTYYQKNTLLFSTPDTVNAGYATSWVNYPGETPIISGGVALTGFTDVGGVWRLDLSTAPATSALWSANWRPSTHIWVNGRRAMWPSFPARGTSRNIVAVSGASSGPSSGDAIIPANTGDASTIGGFTSRGLNADTFGFNFGEIDPAWTNLNNVAIRADSVFSDNLLYIKSVSATSVTMNAHTLNNKLPAGSTWRAENVFEKMQPGDMYLNQSTGVLYYSPRSSDDLSTAAIVAPYLDEIMLVSGAPAVSGYNSGADVGNLKISLQFSHTGSPNGRTGYIGGSSNGVCLPYAAITTIGAANVNIDGSNFIGLGEAAVIHGPGSHDNSVRNSRFSDLGAGGVIHSARVAGNGVRWAGAKLPVWFPRDQYLANHLSHQDNFTATNNVITDIGKLIKCSAHIWLDEGRGFTISNNDLSYGPGWGVKLGYDHGPTSRLYSSGTTSTRSGGNVIAYNHIHHTGYEAGVAGASLISDCSPLYVTGSQGGALNGLSGLWIHHNLVHDAAGGMYPTYYGYMVGTGKDYFLFYADDHISDLLAENNIFYNGDCGGRQIKGQRVTLRNNITYCNFGNRVQGLAGSAPNTFKLAAHYPTPETPATQALTLIDNIDVWESDDDSPGAWICARGDAFSKLVVTSDNNLICKKRSTMRWMVGIDNSTRYSPMALAQWQAAGHDLKAIFADPQFADPARGDFSYPQNSPIHALAGFTPIDLRKAGTSHTIGLR